MGVVTLPSAQETRRLQSAPRGAGSRRLTERRLSVSFSSCNEEAGEYCDSGFNCIRNLCWPAPGCTEDHSETEGTGGMCPADKPHCVYSACQECYEDQGCGV